MNKTNNSAFTLIELLVVIAIIGILASFGLVALNDAKESARDARRVSDLSQFRLALQLYFDDNGHYPLPFNGDCSTDCHEGPDRSYEIVNNNNENSIFSSTNNPLVPIYLNNVLMDPFNTNRYHYFYDTNQNNGHKNYILCFYKESVNYDSRYFTSEGVFAEGDSCEAQALPYTP